MNIKSIAIFYGHVASNVGDIAINRGEVNLLQAAYPQAQIAAVLLNVKNSRYMETSKASFGPEGAVRLVEVSDSDVSGVDMALEPERWLDHCGVAEADLIVLAAGEHLFSYEGNANPRNLFWRTLPAFAARQAGKACLVMPSTFGPYETKSARALMEALVAGGPRIAARETRSLNVLRDLAPGLEPQALLDPAFFIVPPPARPQNEAARNIALVMRSGHWGMRIAEDARLNIKADDPQMAAQETAYRFSLDFCRKVLEETEHRVTMFVQTDADRAIAEAVERELSGSPHAARFLKRPVATIDDYLDALNAADHVVASRFHALILGMVCGKPGYGLYFASHGHKIPGLMELVGRPGDCLDLSAMEVGPAVQAAFDAATAPLDFSQTAARLEALRAATMDWLEADWPERRGAEMTPTDIAALTAIAGGFYQEQAGKFSADAYASRRKQIGMEERLAQRSVEVDELTAQCRSLKEKLDAEHAKCIAYREELSKHTQLESKIRKRDQQIVSLERRLVALEDSTSFQIGNALVLAAKQPRSAAKLPRRIWGIYRSSKDRENVADGTPHVTTKARERDHLLQLHRDRGVVGVSQVLAAKYSSDEVGLRNALIAAGKALRDDGHPQDEITLLREAAASDVSDASLRALYWALQRDGDLKEAWQTIRRLQRIYGDAPSASQNEILDKLRRSAASQLSVVDKIPSSPLAQIAPIHNRICYVLHNSLPFASGGYATRAQGVALGLKEAGFDVVALTRPGFPLDAKPELTADAVPFQDEIEGITYRRLLTPSRQGRSAVGYMEAAADSIAAEFEVIRPAFVMAASNYQTALPALIAARRLGIPFAYEIRGFWEITRISREPEFIHTPSYKIQELLEAETAKHADHVFTLTGPMKQELVRRGVPADHITLLPNSCEPESFVPRPRDAVLAAKLGIPEDVAVIGYIGTFVQYEGLELLVEAAANLRDRGLAFRLLLVGNENVSAGDAGPITTEVQHISQERGLEDWLIMPGRVPHDQVESYYSLIDIAPFPRKAQPVTEMVSPMKPLEAYAMEKAVVASSVGALREMVLDDKTGLVFEKDDVGSLTDALARLIRDPELRARLGKEGRRWVVAERTWGATAKIAADRIATIMQGKS